MLVRPEADQKQPMLRAPHVLHMSSLLAKFHLVVPFGWNVLYLGKNHSTSFYINSNCSEEIFDFFTSEEKLVISSLELSDFFIKNSTIPPIWAPVTPYP